MPSNIKTAEQIEAARKKSPTGFTNFQRFYDGNAQAAKAQADQFAVQAKAKVNAANAATNTAQTQFNTNVGQSSVPKAQFLGAPSNGGPGLTGTSTKPPTVEDPSFAPGSYGKSTDEMKALGEKTYSGPGSLADVEGYQKSVDAGLAADTNLRLLNEDGGLQTLAEQNSGGAGSIGSNRLSGALAGSAGENDFNALRARFDPKGDRAKALDESIKTAAKAKLDSATNAEEWAKLAGIQGDAEVKEKAFREARAKADAEAQATEIAARQNRIPPPSPDGKTTDIFSGIDNSQPAWKEARAKRQLEYNKFMAASFTSENNTVNNAFEDFNSTPLSPANVVTNWAGVRDPVQDELTRKQHGAEGAASGSTQGRNIPWGEIGPEAFWVFRQMDADQWQTLNAKPRNGASGQKAWILNRLAELRMNQSNADAVAKANPPAGHKNQ